MNAEAPNHSAKAAFFDRDGVINVDHGYVHTPDRFEFIDGAVDAIKLCHAAGYLVFIVTNQAGVAYGMYDEAAIATVHRYMMDRLTETGTYVDDIRYCPHHVEAAVPEYELDCPCRKPRPGMLLSLIDKWRIDPRNSFMIGDKDSDMDAAASAGVLGYLFTDGSLLSLVRAAIDRHAHDM